MPLLNHLGSYHLIHSNQYYKVPSGDAMVSYFIVKTNDDVIPLTVVGYKNHKTIERQIVSHFPNTKTIKFIHDIPLRDEPLPTINGTY